MQFGRRYSVDDNRPTAVGECRKTGGVEIESRRGKREWRYVLQKLSACACALKQDAHKVNLSDLLRAANFFAHQRYDKAGGIARSCGVFSLKAPY